MRFWQTLVASGLILSSGAGLLIMSGQARVMFAPDLRADLVVQDFPMPPGMGVDPTRIADFMSRELQERLEEDVAIRLTLPADDMNRVRDIVLPRLMNVVAVQSMLDGIPELSALLDLGSFQRTVSGTVHSAGAAQDVALTVPGARAAAVDGVTAAVTVTSTGMPALELGDMAPGESRVVTLWLDDSAAGVDLGRTVLLGAAEGERGRVLLNGARGWFGADVESLRWGRWLIGGVLASVLIFGVASIVVPLLSARAARGRRAA